MRLFLDSSVLLPACGSTAGAAHEIFRQARFHGSVVMATAYVIGEVRNNLANFLRQRPRSGRSRAPTGPENSELACGNESNVRRLVRAAAEIEMAARAKQSDVRSMTVAYLPDDFVSNLPTDPFMTRS